MAFKLIVLCAALACANAGLAPVAAPVAHYSLASDVSSSYINLPAVAAPVAAPLIAKTYAAPIAQATYAAPIAQVAAVHAPHYGASSQSVVRSLGGGQTVSHYNKAVDSAFSTVRKYDTRITNDAYSVHATPVIAKTYAAAPVVAKTYSYGAPVAAPLVANTYAAPVAPVVTKTYAAPIAHATYAAGPVVAKTYAAPIAHAAYAAPVAHAAYAAPVAHAAYAAPVAAAPVVAKAAIAYSPAVAVSHTTFEGLGAHYQW